MLLRKASLNEFDALYLLRCENTNIRWTGHDVAPNRASLYDWFKKMLNNPNRDIYLYWKDEICIGYLYVDVLDENDREIAYGISEHQQGKGYASSMIDDCIKLLREQGVTHLKAAISDANIASENVALKNGFIKSEEYYYSELPLICDRSKFFIWKRSI